jgi:hypothetical protein
MRTILLTISPTLVTIRPMVQQQANMQAMPTPFRTGELAPRPAGQLDRIPPATGISLPQGQRSAGTAFEAPEAAARSKPESLARFSSCDDWCCWNPAPYRWRLPLTGRR